MTMIEKHREYSENKINELRDAINEAQLSNDQQAYTVITVGSYARREASTESDLDYFVFYDLDSAAPPPSLKRDLETITNILTERIRKPGDTGTFGPDAIESVQIMLKNLGGSDDSNEKFTRRILFLLESESLLHQNNFQNYRKRLLETYIKSTVKEHQLPMFLLNDIIRYYRTICTDFEFKTSECGKPWGIRNIKLMFSRKMIYFSGLVAIADTCHRERKEKIDRLNELFSITPINRILDVCGEQESQKALTMYEDFLSDIADTKIRKHLAQIECDRNTQDETFRRLKNKGHRFSLELTTLLRKTFDATHPIHHAIVM